MLKALDLLRRLGWAVIDFIYNLIDTLFNILKELNLYDIVDSVSENTIFRNFHSGIIAIAITAVSTRFTRQSASVITEIRFFFIKISPLLYFTRIIGIVHLNLYTSVLSSAFSR